MKRFIAAALAVSLLTGSLVAQARDHERGDRHSRHDDRRGHEHARNHHDRDRHRYDAHRWQREHAREHRWDDRRDVSRAYANGYRDGRFHAGRYYRPAGYRYYSWSRGARLPYAYYAPRYVVHDYHRYRLYAPPRGHHWVRVDHDVVLAAVATGAVVAVVNNLFY
jgi:Ni/Co efflux regulator RcnB